MKSLAPCLILASALLISDGVAVAPYVVIGSGAESCGSWTANARAYAPGRGVATLGHQVHLQHRQWVVGFLSGIGAMGVPGINPLNNLDGEGVWAWIGNYCRANPIKDIADAATAFVKEHPR